MELQGLRPMSDEHVPAMIGLVERAFAEHPGMVLDLETWEADLPVLPTKLRAAGGRGWVVERDGEAVAMIGWIPLDDRTGELKRLYTDASVRRAGVGAGLVNVVIDAVQSSGRSRVELWTDSRFTDAHRLYERLGFVRQPATRELHDPSNTCELRYVLEFAG